MILAFMYILAASVDMQLLNNPTRFYCTANPLSLRFSVFFFFFRLLFFIFGSKSELHWCSGGWWDTDRLVAAGGETIARFKNRCFPLEKDWIIILISL